MKFSDATKITSCGNINLLGSLVIILMMIYVCVIVVNSYVFYMKLPMNETLVLFQCVQYMDETTFAAMLPRLQELLRTSVGLGTRVATAHFIVLLCHHLTTQQFQPYVGTSCLASHSAFHPLNFHLWPQIVVYLFFPHTCTGYKTIYY